MCIIPPARSYIERACLKSSWIIIMRVHRLTFKVRLYLGLCAVRGTSDRSGNIIGLAPAGSARQKIPRSDHG